MNSPCNYYYSSNLPDGDFLFLSLHNPLHLLIRSLLKRRAILISCFTFQFNYLFLLVWISTYLFCLVVHNPLLSVCILLFKLSRFGHLELLKLRSSLLSTCAPSILCGNFHTLWHGRYSKLILCFPSPRSGIIHFPKKSWFLLLESCIQKSRPEINSLPRGIAVSRLSLSVSG